LATQSRVQRVDRDDGSARHRLRDKARQISLVSYGSIGRSDTACVIDAMSTLAPERKSNLRPKTK
jgi:hypothetical protein